MTPQKTAGQTSVGVGKRVDQVIVAVDFSDRSWSVVPLARAVASAWSAAIEFVHVDTASPWISASAPGRLQLRTTHLGRTTEVEVAAGAKVAECIDEVRRSKPASLVAIATHGRVGLSELTWGSVTQDLLVGFSAPLLAAGPRFAWPNTGIDSVTVCLGPGDLRTNLAGDAKLWAGRLGVPLTLLAVAATGENPRLWERLSAMATDLSDNTVEVTVGLVESHRPSHAIVRHCEANPGTLLVMSPGGRSRAARALLGSVTREVLRRSPVGLLLLPWPEIVAVPAPRPDADGQGSAPGETQPVTACHDEYRTTVVQPALPSEACHDDYAEWE